MWNWRKVLTCADPARKWRQKVGKIEEQLDREKATPVKRKRKSRVVPGSNADVPDLSAMRRDWREGRDQ